MRTHQVDSIVAGTEGQVDSRRVIAAIALL